VVNAGIVYSYTRLRDWYQVELKEQVKMITLASQLGDEVARNNSVRGEGNDASKPGREKVRLSAAAEEEGAMLGGQKSAQETRQKRSNRVTEAR
jgi:hypothetical protein